MIGFTQRRRDAESVCVAEGDLTDRDWRFSPVAKVRAASPQTFYLCVSAPLRES